MESEGTVAFDSVLKGGGNLSPARAFPRSSMHCLSKQEVLQFVRERQDLFDAAGKTNPFASSAWVLHFIEHIARDDWTFTVPACLGDGESLMLLYADGQAPHRRLAVANCYASLYSPLISSARDRNAVLGALADKLTERSSACAAVRWAPLDRDSPDTPALERAFAERGWYVRRHFAFGNWHLPCTGLSFEEYMAGRDSRLYNTWLRKSKKFQGPGSDARLEIVTGGPGLEAAMDAYEKVYARSWKEPEEHPHFIRGWARICARNGWLRLGLAWVGEVPVAAQFWFTLHGRANVFKLAYDEQYSRWSAGTVLTAHMFRHSLEEDRVAEIDYLTGDDPYKRSWMSARRERIGLVACNPRSLRGLMLAAGEWGSEISRPWRGLIRPTGHPGIAAQP